MQVMKIEEAKKRSAYLEQIRPLCTKLFQHFETEQQKKEHLEYVEKNKAETPF